MANALKKTMSKFFLLAMILTESAAYAANPSPIGLWRTIDDHTGKPRGLALFFDSVKKEITLPMTSFLDS